MSTNKNIKRFQLPVTVEDSSVFVSKSVSLIKTLSDIMRGQGFVPVLDLGVHVTVDYDGEKFNYTLTQHGIYLGKVTAWKIEGLSGDKLIPRNIHTSK